MLFLRSPPRLPARGRSPAAWRTLLRVSGGRAVTRRGTSGHAADRVPGAAELAGLTRWLLRVKGSRSFAELSAAAGAAGRPVTTDTLRRAPAVPA
ncbi:hypothetical protein GCM10010390_39930 [Streptomyces mordarskii]|uniref:Uncharacterized protein n=1 Tax=Streptomyces mordarskii TaxID=1226758 RepID=A0ABN1D4J3_9ACTN